MPQISIESDATFEPIVVPGKELPSLIPSGLEPAEADWLSATYPEYEPSAWTAKLTEEQSARIAAAEAFDLSGVTKRYCRDYEVDEALGLERAREVKRFLALCAMSTDDGYGMFGPVDILWHVFIFFTREYHAFCDVAAGKYLHHVPGAKSERHAGHLNKDGYVQMLVDYRAVFGVAPPLAHWPRKPRMPAGVASATGENACGSCIGDTGCNGVCSVLCVACTTCTIQKESEGQVEGPGQSPANSPVTASADTPAVA